MEFEGRLAELLDAAAAPARPHELAGQDAAVAGFRREYRVRHRRRRAVIMAVAALAAVSIGGTAVAASAGRSFFGLAPAVSAPRSASAAPSVSPPAPPSPAPGRPSATASAAPLAEACAAWLAFLDDPHAGPVTADERRALAEAAGGESAIDDYCGRAAPTKRPKPSHTPGHPTGRPSTKPAK